MLLVNHRRSLKTVVAITLAATLAAACKAESTGQASAAQATPPQGVSQGVAQGTTQNAPHGAPEQGAPPGAARDSAGGARGGSRGNGGGSGGRAASAITLASTDVAVVKRETIEAGIPITGDLHPIETISVRARIEGDLMGVFVREGERVSAGQLLTRFESSEQETSQSSAEADVSSAKSDLATAQWNLDQSRDLFKAGAIAERDLKVAEQTVESAKARLAAANSKLTSTSNVIRDTRVLAPTAGVIDKRLVQNGERVTRGQQLFSLVRNDALELAAAVPAKQATAVRPGQVVHFVADARNFDGTVARVSPTIDPTTRAVTVYVTIPNRDGALKGGTFASGRVVQRTISGAIVVPSSALRQAQENGQTFVYRIANRAVDAAQIQLGVIDERVGKAEVLSGLNEGDRVIVGNVGILGRGMQVTVLGSEDQGGSRPNGRRGGRAGGRGAGGRGQPNSTP
ncbi:MAG TPA: efflux RND transporter periplasmic adaptor subunit [Gemmatimonadaceae bacterium]|nr:efflux RND transporter periplasmic adaptor subunit [Gemmatimonadaceae bacterium]